MSVAGHQIRVAGTREVVGALIHFCCHHHFLVQVVVLQDSEPDYLDLHFPYPRLDYRHCRRHLMTSNRYLPRQDVPHGISYEPFSTIFLPDQTLDTFLPSCTHSL
jgi:hypothetical protein